ncbi:TetR/AcrR family transcriptional regulator [Thalassotalea fusca]
MDKAQIFDKAVELAQQSSWEAFSLAELASSLQCSMAELKTYFRSKDDIAEVFFDLADEAMLKMASQSEFNARYVDDRLLECIMCWFYTLVPYKKIVREVLAYKLEPGHFHLQAHGITRISRTVQWFLEASGRKRKGVARITDEVAITGAYLTSFAFFLRDNSTNHQRTRKLLNNLINKISKAQDRLSHCYYLHRLSISPGKPKNKTS